MVAPFPVALGLESAVTTLVNVEVGRAELMGLGIGVLSVLVVKTMEVVALWNLEEREREAEFTVGWVMAVSFLVVGRD